MADDVATEELGDVEENLDGSDDRVVALLGPAHEQVLRYGGLLAEEGVLRGLIGPREVPRLWERHIVNCAAVASFLPASGTVVDVGTGAGLPGVILAAMRPELHIVLLEPMERRVTWLNEVVAALGLSSAEVVRGRAEELHGTVHADAVTARAVAPMDRLASWTLPLLRTGGVLVAMKGERAQEELDAATDVLAAMGGSPGQIVDAPTIPGMRPTRLVRVVKVAEVAPVPLRGTRPLPAKARKASARRR